MTSVNELASPIAACYRISARHWILFVAVLLAAVTARLLWPERTSLNFDELMSLHLSAGHNFAVDHLPRGVILHTVPDLLTINGARPWWRLWSSLSGDVHPPLYYLALRVWREMFGDSAMTLRSLSALFGTLSVAMVAFAGRELAGTACGLLASAAMALAATGVFYGQEVRMYAMAMFLVPLAIGAVLRVERLGFNVRRGALVAVSTLSLVLTLYLAVGVCMALGLYALLRLHGRERRGVLAALALAAVAFVVSWGPFMLRQDWTSEKSNWLRSPPGTVGHVSMTLQRLVPAPVDQFGVLRHDDLWSGNVYAIVLLFLPAMAAALKNRRVLLPYLAMLAAFGVPTLRDIVSTTNMMAYDRYTAIALPAQTLALVGGCMALLQRWPRLLPALALMTYSAVSLPTTLQRTRYDFRENAIVAEREYREGNRRLLVMTHGVIGYNGGLLLALCRYWQEWPREVILVDSPEQAESLPREVIGDEVVVVAGHETHPPRYLSGFELTGRQTFDGGVGYVVVLRRTTSPSPGTTTHAGSPAAD